MIGFLALPFELDQSLLAMVKILLFLWCFFPKLGGKGIHVAMCALKRPGGGYDYLLDGFGLANERMRPLSPKMREHVSI